jgi:hypothetical protein
MSMAAQAAWGGVHQRRAEALASRGRVGDLL